MERGAEMNDTLETNMEYQAVHQSYNNEEEYFGLNKSEIQQQIINTIYSHYEKPENIIEEKLTFYKNYSTPAGYKLPDWNEGGWQRGRLSIYTSKDNLVRISDSWFFHTDGRKIKIFVNGKKDVTLEISRKS